MTNNISKIKVLLIRKKKERVDESARSIITPPYDLMQLAQIARQENCEVKISDELVGDDIIIDTQNFQPDFVLEDITTPTFKTDMEILIKIKEIKPNCKIIVKGEPFLTYNTNVVYENPFIDFVITGETEYSLKEIISEKQNSEILGICYSENYQGIKNEPRPLEQNIDLITYQSREFTKNHLYKNNEGKNYTIIEISRGCPCQCLHCLKSAMQGDKIRSRSIESIIYEIKECIQKYNINNFYFKANIINFDEEYLKNLCSAIIENDLKINWSTKICAGDLDKNLIKLMKKSGCNELIIEAVSGSDEILNKFPKNFTTKSLKEMVFNIKKNKIKIITNFLIGLPWDNEETIEKTLKFAIKLDVYKTNFKFPIPTPGTKFFAYVMVSKLTTEGLSFANSEYEPTVRTHQLQKEDIIKFQKKANRICNSKILKFLNKLKYKKVFHNFV